MGLVLGGFSGCLRTAPAPPPTATPPPPAASNPTDTMTANLSVYWAAPFQANIEKCKKRNRRRSAYGRQAKKDESMMF